MQKENNLSPPALLGPEGTWLNYCGVGIDGDWKICNVNMPGKMDNPWSNLWGVPSHVESGPFGKGLSLLHEGRALCSGNTRNTLPATLDCIINLSSNKVYVRKFHS